VEVVLVLVALILVSIGFAITLGMLLFGSNRAALPSTTHMRGETEDVSKARAKAESELARKQKELDEQRSQLQDLKEQLKQTKRKLFEQKESEKGDRDLVKARTEVERQASQQLEVVRVELAQALAELERLRGQQDGGRARRAPAPASATAPAAAPTTPTTPAPDAAASAPATGQISAPAQEGERVVTAAVQVTPAAEPAGEKDKGARRYRELNDADREKMERLEHSANKERTRAAELDRELKRVKGRTETQQRIFNATKGELDLVKDKYKALEKRLNRTLLERDLLRRAIKDLEKKTGMAAERTELTPEEMAASDQRTEEVARERAATEAQQAAKTQAEAEAAAKPPETTDAPAPAPGEADKAPATNA
jgi:chromosome segregation ATPase